MHREIFIRILMAQLGKTVCWGFKGPDCFDCSGLFTFGLMSAGGPDLRETDNAQSLARKTRALGPGEKALPGDAVFYGFSADTIEHVAVIISDSGGIVSADGATSRLTDPKVAAQNPAHQVRLHASVLYRSDTPFVVVHRNTFIDALDHVDR